MSFVRLDRDPAPRDLFWFGVLFPVFWAVVGALAAPGLRWWLWGGAAAVTLAYALAPAVRRPVYVGWTALVLPIGWVVSHVVLAAAFYLVLTPIGLLRRLGGSDAMGRRFDRQATSYWIARGPDAEAGRYYRQF